LSQEVPNTFGLVVSRSYPDLEALPQRIADLDRPGTVWVCAETDLEAKRLLEPYESILLPLVPAWKVGDLDLRRQWRDCELLHLCSRVYVFQKAGAKTTWNIWANERYGIHDHVSVIEAGKPKVRPRVKRKAPVGA
jgi:hypothetical protein